MIFEIAIALFVIYILLRPRKGAQGAPPCVQPTSKIPVLGSCIEFGASPMKMVKRCYEEYGPVFTLNIFHKRLTFLVGPEAHEPFFKLGDNVLAQEEVYGFMKTVFGAGVVYDATRKKRQVQFQSMANGLRVSRLKNYVPKIEKETRDFIESWGDEGEIDLLSALSELTILTSSRCLHGDDVREQLFAKVAELYHDLDHGVTPLTVFMPNAPTTAHRKRDIAKLEMDRLFGKIIESRRKDPTKGSDGTDILSIFMNTKYKDGTPVTNEEVSGLLIALLFAGQHTSSISSTWTLMFIAAHPDILKRVVAEQDAIMGDASEPLTFEKVAQMDLLYNCMQEALRLCPPLILLMRQVKKEFEVTAKGKTYTIPKDDIVMVSPYAGMRIPEVFADPDAYDPDRYSPPREEHKQPFSYLGFGGGMHSCMGEKFAFLQVRTILSILLREYEIEMVGEKFPEPDFEAMVVGPKGDCRIRYKRRVHAIS
mmetsp:Transcript_65429/g.76881  ORF Transcript_65429/g.76881 Transcript_65429/m.76881 type:complete len:480 (+) Transcript_65429:215-1654(+)|eukprot:CAMPEP_0194354654 /NCGR_PEP_ID=MMETSP0174-20130528/2744_1 /TAXON_ID=216777 /ORGANISM="Proboscia alata, Strain PI-D3" /LENGTH=479 /DNA_ID=CAMNT_0039123659 /DNA_START=189 /DNA_END=1628 /DNA_ORIENTATION=+